MPCYYAAADETLPSAKNMNTTDNMLQIASGADRDLDYVWINGIVKLASYNTAYMPTLTVAVQASADGATYQTAGYLCKDKQVTKTSVYGSSNHVGVEQMIKLPIGTRYCRIIEENGIEIDGVKFFL